MDPLNCNFPECNLSITYEKLSTIENGAFGHIYKGRNKMDPENIVIMKEVQMDCGGDLLPTNTLREVYLLKTLKHQNILKFLEIYRANRFDGRLENYYLIFEYCDYDLKSLILNTRVEFQLSEIKQILQQILFGLYFIHNKNVLHRNLKPANILIDKNGTIKISDFGSARLICFHEDGRPNYLTPMVGSLWYKAPELLLGDINYGPGIDMWSMGMIMAEMFTRFPITQGESEHHQICYITKLCGTIKADIWPNVVNLGLFRTTFILQGERRKVVASLAPYVRHNYGLDMINRLLVLDPVDRMNIDEAVNHEFFWTDPLPSDLQDLLTRFVNTPVPNNADVASTSFAAYNEFQARV